MKNLFQFFLEGYGCLEGVEQKDGKTMARLRVEHIPPFLDAPQPDEIALYCAVESQSLLSIVNELESKRLAGRTIMMGFHTHYSHVGDCFSGRTPEDPNNMLVLYGKLISIRGWLENMAWFEPGALKLKKAYPFFRASKTTVMLN